MSDESLKDYVDRRFEETSALIRRNEEWVRPIIDDELPIMPPSIFPISIPITNEMLEDFSYSAFDPSYKSNEEWKDPTRLMRLRWRINELRSRCIDAWMVLTGKETLEYREEYDEDEEY